MNEREKIPSAEYPDLLSGCSKILVVRLRSIGDTVLATPTLRALRRHLPNAEIDILLEDWVAPLLEGHSAVDSVIPVGRGARERATVAMKLRRTGYDAVINLHGGTTSTFLARATGALIRAGFADYRYSFLYTHLLGSAAGFWNKSATHSAEQQLALAGFLGVPVGDRPSSELEVTETAREFVENALSERGFPGADTPVALIHPAAATFTKQWDVRNFAALSDLLSRKGYFVAAVVSAREKGVLEAMTEYADTAPAGFSGLSLPQVTALAEKASVFAGNDSGIAHIAAAVGTPPLVIFGSSNRDHWGPWTKGPSSIVFKSFECQPCPGYECAVYGDPRCIREVGFEQVRRAFEELESRL